MGLMVSSFVVGSSKSSGGSVDTTKTRSGPQRVRVSSGARPIGAAKGKQPNTKALCQPPPPPVQPNLFQGPQPPSQGVLAEWGQPQAGTPLD